MPNKYTMLGHCVHEAAVRNVEIGLVGRNCGRQAPKSVNSTALSPAEKNQLAFSSPLEFDALMQMDYAEKYGCAMPQVNHIRYLDSMYPGSKFVFCYRNLDDWLTSLSAWGPGSGRPVNDYPQRIMGCMDRLKVPKQGESVGEILKNFYLWQFRRVLKYFEGRAGDLVIIDLYGDLNSEMLDAAFGLKAKIVDGQPQHCFGHANMGKNLAKSGE
jgi:hypothetical protein